MINFSKITKINGSDIVKFCTMIFLVLSVTYIIYLLVSIICLIRCLLVSTSTSIILSNNIDCIDNTDCILLLGITGLFFYWINSIVPNIVVVPSITTMITCGILMSYRSYLFSLIY